MVGNHLAVVDDTVGQFRDSDTDTQGVLLRKVQDGRAQGAGWDRLRVLCHFWMPAVAGQHQLGEKEKA